VTGAPVGKSTAAPPARAAAPRPAAAAPASAASAAEVPGAEVPAEKSGTRRWIIAGCGCLFLMVACVGLLFFLDAYYPDTLYAPLRALGF